MKTKFKTLFFAAVLFCCFTACDKDEQPKYNPNGSTPIRHYEWTNRSNHTIRMEFVNYYPSGEPAEKYLHTLVHGQTIGNLSAIANSGCPYDKENLYFDERYVIKASALPSYMEVYSIGPYEESLCSDRVTHLTYTYVFTDDHYDYAVAHGTDLGEPKPATEQ